MESHPVATHRVETDEVVSKKGGLTVLALLALVAATAPGLALTRALPDFMGIDKRNTINFEYHGTGSSGYGVQTHGGVFSPLGRPLKYRASYWLGHVPYWSGPCLVSWTLAAMAMGLRRPRPPLRRPALGPGVAAGVAIILALAVKAIECLQFLTVHGMPLTNLKRGWRGPWSYFWITLPGLAGYTVAASWLILALSGRWSARPGVQDRLGRLLGWCWIAMAVSSTLGVWCFALNY